MSTQASSSSAAAAGVLDSPGVKEDPRVRTKARDVLAQRRYVEYLKKVRREVRADFDRSVDVIRTRSDAMATAIDATASKYLNGDVRSDVLRASAGSMLSSSIAVGAEALIEEQQRMAAAFTQIKRLSVLRTRAKAKLARLVQKRAEEQAKRGVDLLEEFARRHVGMAEGQLQLARAAEREAQARALASRTDALVDSVGGASGKLARWNMVRRSQILGAEAAEGFVGAPALDVRFGIRLDGRDRAETALSRYRDARLSAEDALRSAAVDEGSWTLAMREAMRHIYEGDSYYRAARSARARHLVQLENHSMEVAALSAKTERQAVGLRNTLYLSTASSPVLVNKRLTDLEEAKRDLTLALQIAAQATAGERFNTYKPGMQFDGEYVASAAERERMYAAPYKRARKKITTVSEYISRHLDW